MLSSRYTWASYVLTHPEKYLKSQDKSRMKNLKMHRENPVHKVECPIDPISKQAFESHPGKYVGHESLVDLPLYHQMRITMQQVDAQKIRKQLMITPDIFGGDLHIETMADSGGADNSLIMKATKMPMGTYNGAVKTWLFQFFDKMPMDVSHWIKFKSGDTMLLAFLIADSYLAETGNFVRVEATGLGTKHTLFFGKTEDLRRNETDKVSKARQALTKQKAKKKEIIQALDAPARMGPAALRPYHDLNPGESVYMAPDEYTTLISLRSVVYSFGMRKNRKYKVAVAPAETGGVHITRLE